MTRAVRYGMFLLLLFGCGGGGPATHPVSGRVAGGEPLTGHTVELALATDPTVRAYGTIGPDGRFTLATLADGKVLNGVRPGRYDARVVIADEGDGQTKKPKVPARFLAFKQSGWAVEVPAAGEVTLTVAAK